MKLLCRSTSPYAKVYLEDVKRNDNYERGSQIELINLHCFPDGLKVAIGCEDCTIYVISMRNQTNEDEGTYQILDGVLVVWLNVFTDITNL